MLDASRPFVLAALWCGVLAAAVGPARAADGGPVTTGEERRFLAEVAPVLAKRCLECHGPTSRQGGFDLSHRDRLAAGGVNGVAVVARKADDSPLWQYVDSDAMPPDGPPLSEAEKAVLKKWIDSGAPWPQSEPWAVLHAAGGEAAGAGWVRRLTAPEYLASVRAVAGVDLAADAARLLPADLRADGFHNTAYNLAVDLDHVRAYAELARLAVARADLPALLKEHARGKTTPERVESLGELALRGPLSEEETAAFVAVAEAMKKEGGTEEEALGLALEAMLQSPRFLYRIETQRGDGATRPVRGHELANRLSYTLWGAPPDAALRTAAERGELTADPAGRAALQTQIVRLLDDPRARERSARFAHEWLNLDRMDALSPAAERFPNWNPALAGDMRRETRAFFNHVAWSERPLTALLTDRTAFLTPRLAAHYGLDWKALAENAVLLAPPEPTGVVALYDFAGEGNTVRDRSGQDSSGTGEPLDLEIAKGAKVRRTPAGLKIEGPSQIAAPRPAKRLTAALKRTGEITVEVWLTPADAKQAGPARIVTLSDGSNQRNVTLGQDGKKYDARLRTTSNTDKNGMPSTSSDDAVDAGRPTHVVFTRRSTGLARLWVDGAMRGNRNTEGSFGNWEDGFRFALAGEVGADRPWRGTLHRVVVYDRALTDEEIAERASAPWRVDLPEDAPRRGLLTQGATLTVGGDEASTVARGLFVLRNLLLGSIGDPPPGVDTTPVPAGPGLSQRQMAEKRLEDASCAGCHVQFEPFAFAFERYDGLGAFRTKDHHGNALRTDGAVKLPGGERATFATTGEFLDLIAAGEPVRRGLTRKLTQFALGRPLTPADEPAVQAIHDAAWSKDTPHGPGSYRSVMAAIAGSDLTLTAPTEPAALSSASPTPAER